MQDRVPGRARASTSTKWTHPSVVGLAQGADPIEVIAERARALVLDALTRGWGGPPFDPMALADILGIPVVPREDVLDARLVPAGTGTLSLEFNPNRPRGRVRFSVAHELAHSFFPDCADTIRERGRPGREREDDWQLELLCNVGAAEILMPIGSFPELGKTPLSIDRLMTLRRDYDVSTEALLLRAVKLTETPCSVFVSSVSEPIKGSSRYHIDYLVPSTERDCPVLPRGVLPSSSVVEACTAIGYTAKGDEQWAGAGEVHVECVGIPPFPGHRYPRVAGVVTYPSSTGAPHRGVTYVKGDATAPHGRGQRIIAFIVNDRALRWGAGFGKAMQRKWRSVQRDFEEWAVSSPLEFKLGNVHATEIDNCTAAFAMIAQKGYGESAKPRIRYDALDVCLGKLAQEAGRRPASVHMPRIGTGHAGGKWAIVSELIDQHLCRQGIDVTVYDLPGTEFSESPTQRSLFPFREWRS